MLLPLPVIILQVPPSRPHPRPCVQHVAADTNMQLLCVVFVVSVLA